MIFYLSIAAIVFVSMGLYILILRETIQKLQRRIRNLHEWVEDLKEQNAELKEAELVRLMKIYAFEKDCG